MVVGADVKQAIRLWRVGVEGDEVGRLCDAIEHSRLILGGDHADGDGVVALASKVLYDLVLVLGRAVGRHLDVDLNLTFLFVLANAGSRALPESTWIVGHESKLDELAGSFAVAAGAAEQQPQGQCAVCHHQPKALCTAAAIASLFDVAHHSCLLSFGVTNRRLRVSKMND